MIILLKATNHRGNYYPPLDETATTISKIAAFTSLRRSCSRSWYIIRRRRRNFLIWKSRWSFCPCWSLAVSAASSSLKFSLCWSKAETRKCFFIYVDETSIANLFTHSVRSMLSTKQIFKRNLVYYCIRLYLKWQDLKMKELDILIIGNLLKFSYR